MPSTLPLSHTVDLPGLMQPTPQPVEGRALDDVEERPDHVQDPGVILRKFQYLSLGFLLYFISSSGRRFGVEVHVS